MAAMPDTRGQACRNGSGHQAKRGIVGQAGVVHAPLSPAHDRFGLIRIHVLQKRVLPHFSPLHWNAAECVIFITCILSAGPIWLLVRACLKRAFNPNRTVRSCARVFGSLLEFCSCAVQHWNEYAKRSELFSEDAKKYSEEMPLTLLKKAANQINYQTLLKRPDFPGQAPEGS